MLSDMKETRAEEVRPPSPTETRLLVAAFSRVRPVALGLSTAAVSALALFSATSLLLIAALGDEPGTPIGTNLGRLGNYLPGYDISWSGAFIGLAYGAAIGFVAGALLGFLLNLSHAVYVRLVIRRMREGVIDGAL